jgi:hypothetical protein
MDKQDQLGWNHGFSITSFGLTIGFRSNDAEVLEQLTPLFPPDWSLSSVQKVERLYSLLIGGPSPDGRSRRFNLLYADLGRIARAHDLESVFNTFERDIATYVAEFARERTFVHAGVVGWRGKAIVVPGRTLTGKSTLVAELVRAGATYYSDEYAVLDEEGFVHPYPRQISLRDETNAHTDRFPAEALGGIIGDSPLPIGLILVTNYKERARWNPRKLTPGQAAIALMANTISARHDPVLAMAALQKAVVAAEALKGSRPDASKIVESLLDRW